MERFRADEATFFGVPKLGAAEGGHPDVFRFPRFLPNFFRLAVLVFANTPVCSDLFREQIRETPFC